MSKRNKRGRGKTTTLCNGQRHTAQRGLGSGGWNVRRLEHRVAAAGKMVTRSGVVSPEGRNSCPATGSSSSNNSSADGQFLSIQEEEWEDRLPRFPSCLWLSKKHHPTKKFPSPSHAVTCRGRNTAVGLILCQSQQTKLYFSQPGTDL